MNIEDSRAMLLRMDIYRSLDRDQTVESRRTIHVLGAYLEYGQQLT